MAPQIWHRMLGHPSLRILKTISQDLNISLLDMNSCIHYDVSKIHKQSLPNSISITSFPSHLLHGDDIWGSSTIPTVSGFQFYLVIIDDFSHFLWVFLLKKK